MMFIDMTKELSPVLFGLNAALIVSAAALVSHTAARRWLGSIARFEWRRLVLHRPALAR